MLRDSLTSPYLVPISVLRTFSMYVAIVLMMWEVQVICVVCDPWAPCDPLAPIVQDCTTGHSRGRKDFFEVRSSLARLYSISSTNSNFKAVTQSFDSLRLY